MKILIIGAGEISKEYVRALQSLGETDIAILSKTLQSAQNIQQQFDLPQSFGGGEKTLRKIVDDFEAFIVAVPIEYLLDYLYLLTEFGRQHILVEKPVVLHSQELEQFLRQYPDSRATVGLNRLYFPSIVTLGRRLMDEGITSAQFSFTEWVHRIDPNHYHPKVLQSWGVSNCIHVIATVFHIIGCPKEMSCFVSGQNVIPWHPGGAVFSGGGLSETGVPFSYLSDWCSAGRWSLSCNTTMGSYQLAPMEELLFCRKGQMGFETIVPRWQGELKCGFSEMLQRWLAPNRENDLVLLPKVLEYVRSIEKIFYYAQ